MFKKDNCMSWVRKYNKNSYAVIIKNQTLSYSRDLKQNVIEYVFIKTIYQALKQQFILIQHKFIEFVNENIYIMKNVRKDYIKSDVEAQKISVQN